jgi:hypothetical protein
VKPISDIDPRFIPLRSGGLGYLGVHDPQSRTSGGFTAISNGWRVTLTGGLVALDRSDWARATFRLHDVLRNRCPASEALIVGVQLRVRAHVGNSTDAAVAVVLHNEEDLTTATVDGFVWEFYWAGATRGARCPRLLNGAQNDLGSAAVTSTTLDRFQGATSRNAIGAWTHGTLTARNEAGAHVGATDTQGPLSDTQWGTAAPFISIIAGRTASTAGDVTPEFDVGVTAVSLPELA